MVLHSIDGKNFRISFQGTITPPWPERCRHLFSSPDFCAAERVHQWPLSRILNKDEHAMNTVLSVIEGD
jgi:hypothetical protein